MGYYVSYELISAIMLLITIIIYTYKNWIPVKRNRVYLSILCVCILGTLVDMFVEMLIMELPRYANRISLFGIIVISLFQVALMLQLLIYNMAFTGTMKLKEAIWFRLLLVLCAIVSVYIIAGPFAGWAQLRRSSGTNYYLEGNEPQKALYALLLIADLILLITYRRKLTHREQCILIGSDALLLIGLVLQTLLHSRNLTSFYTVTLVFVIYYMLLHNIDRYRFLSSGCFSRAGFNNVLREKALYKENFQCLGICINNIESITNFCTEDEIMQIHRILGDILKKICGRHNVYHAHSFEYLIICKNEQAAEELHEELIGGIPLYIRLNNKNISILCDFYTLQFAEAEYSVGNFHSILTTMRKLAMEQMDRHKLLHYEGDSQENISKDLEAMRIVNTCISKKTFALQLSPICAVDATEDTYSYEFSLCAHYSDGSLISQEQIWELAGSMGHAKELGSIVFELICKYIRLQKLQDQKIDKVHINLTPTQLLGETVADEYIDCLKRYQIPGEFICIEVTIDLTVDYKVLERCIKRLHEHGVSVLLDQFGVTVCNLRTVLEMPFDAVKVNHHMVRGFYEGISSQLTYLLDMLNVKQWKIYVDGIDEKKMVDFMSELKFSYMQGEVMLEKFEKHHSDVFQSRNGGAAFD